MTVKELRDKLAKFNDKDEVLIYWENGNEQTFLDINDLSQPHGKANRIAGKRAFKFTPEGSAERVFINVSAE